jgi:hypothetical protein
MKLRRSLAITFMVCCVALGISMVSFRPLHGQFGPTTTPGFFTGVVPAFTPALTAGAAGTVTNTSGLLMQIDGGPVFCSGNQSSIAESAMSLAANTTFLLVYNCPQELVYAKTAVTAPGTSPTTGLPATILAPVAGIEIPLATVVCGASTCATITDARPAGLFPSGAVQTGSVTFANLPATFPNGAALYCSNCTVASSPCTGASTGAMALRVNGAWRCQ